MTVAALFVEPDGPYAGLDSVDLWPESRDARLYNEAHPVVAHPPCARWSPLASVNAARYPGYIIGADGGCFASSLDSVRRCGGVMEHPERSKAWARHGLRTPPASGGWYTAGDGIGWACCVAQRNYGHRARKRTLLYAVGCDLPSLVWGDGLPGVWIGGSVEMMGKRERRATPEPFRDLLLSMARSVA